jgi:hypothetical protein
VFFICAILWTCILSNFFYMKRFFALVRAGVSQAYTKVFPNTMKKRTWWPLFVVGVLLALALSVTFTYAMGDDILTWVANTFSRLLLELAKLCIFLTIFFLRFFITLASYNNFIDVSVVMLGWVMVRDVANMFFIVGLLVIAFATILGFEGYEWKKGVVKIVLMAILINFSNLIAQVVIDVAHIFTITFLNAISATAGGNLITLFQFDKILGLISGAPDAIGNTRDGAGLTMFAASVMSFIFALLAALTIGAYLLVMMARIVVLWALIILSPLAFMMYALPKGEEYAREWWNEFSKHVIVAPIMVFFLWLAFATFGTGQIMHEIQHGPGSENVIRISSSEEQQSVSLLEVTTWENMASFLLGIAFLIVGIKKTQDTGATGSGLIGSAVDFTKNVATIATGYAAGRWLVGKGGEAGKAVGVGTFNRIPIVGGKAFKEYGAGIKSAYQRKGLLGVATLGKKSGLGGFESAIRRSETAKDYEKNGFMGSKGLGWIAARIVEPAGRAEKRAKDWEETTERAQKILEESYSTSSSNAGKAKLKTTAELRITEAFSKEKGEEKMQNEMDRLRKEAPDLTGKTKEEKEQIFAEMKKKDFMAGQAQERVVETANLSQKVKELKRGEDVRRAELEAMALRENGKHAKAASVIKTVYQKQFKEDQEEFQNMEYNERVNQAKIISEQLTSPTVNAETKKNLRKDAIKLLTIAAGNSEEEYTQMLDGMIEKVYGGAKQEFNSNNAGQRFLEAVTGKQIANYDQFDEAHKLLEGKNTFRDTGESQTILATYSASIKKGAVKQGGVRNAGVIVEDDPQENVRAQREVATNAPVGYRVAANPDFVVADPRVQAILDRDRDKKKGTEEYFHPRVDLQNATNLRGYMGVKGDRVVSVSEVQRKGLLDVLSQFGDQRSVAQGFSSTVSMGNKKTEFDPDARKQIVALLHELRENYVNAGLNDVFNRILDTQFSEWSGETADIVDANNIMKHYEVRRA